MNPNSIEGNQTNGSQSSKNSLFFRLSLGGELYTGSNSIHPGITGSSPVTQSFIVTPYTASFTNASFISNTEYNYYNQVPSRTSSTPSTTTHWSSTRKEPINSQPSHPSTSILHPSQSTKDFSNRFPIQKDQQFIRFTNTSARSLTPIASGTKASK